VPDVSPTAADIKGMLASKATRTAWWFLIKACLPSVVLILFYPLYLYILHVPDPFAHAFGHGDFLLLALLLLLEVALEHHYLRSGSAFGLQTLRIVALVVAVGFTLMFAWTKLDIIALLPSVPEAERHSRMLLYAKVNCYAVIIAVVLGLCSYYTACASADADAHQKATE
jgi:hypothetical protein